MIDIQLLRDQPEIVKDSCLRKKCDPNLIDQVLEVDRQYRETLESVESLRSQRNTLTKEDKDKGIQIKQKLQTLEPSLKDYKQQRDQLLLQIPNLVHKLTPKGQSEDDNVELRQVGTKPLFNFTPQDHVTLSKHLDLIDFEKGAQVSGSQFYYLKNEAVLLEIALINYALDILIKEGFTPLMTPDLAKSRYYLGTGYQPKGQEAQTYVIQDEDLGLIATAEVTLAGYHADHVFNYKDLPKKYVGVSHCFRQEAGAYGKFSKGLYRVHQFTKIEMYAFCTPDQSDQIHTDFLNLEEKIWQGLEIPYRVLEMCDADLGGQAVRKYDLEAWMPGKGENGEWGEITSTSNTTDFQARRLNIKYQDIQGKNQFAHTLNGTAIAVSRAIVAIIENFQTANKEVAIPKVLQPYMGGRTLINQK